MLFSQLAVALGVAALPGHGFSTQFPLHHCRSAHHQGPGRDIFGDHCSGCDQGASSHSDPIEHNRSNPNQAWVFLSCRCRLYCSHSESCKLRRLVKPGFFLQEDTVCIMNHYNRFTCTQAG